MAFKHRLTLDVQNDMYSLKIDGKIVRTSSGPVKDKPLEFLFLGIASLDDKIYNEGILVCGLNTEVNIELLEYIGEACERYQELVQQKTCLENICRKTKINLNKLNNEIPELY